VELEQNSLAASRLKLENGIRVLKMALGQHIGIASDSFDVEQPDFTGIAPPATATDHQLSLQSHPEYRLLEKSVDVAKLQLRMETGKNLPNIAVGAGYNYVDFDNGKSAEMEKKMEIAFAVVSVPLSGWWGISILSDLFDAQNLLQQSRDRYVEAATEYCVKLEEYEKATGR
jgi:outer membrane protein TolC